MIPFYKKVYKDTQEAIDGDRDYRLHCTEFYIDEFNQDNFFLTKSCTQSLELAIMSLNLHKGKEVILPSYGFVSIANAVALNGLKCVFVDCDPDTMNINVEAAIHAITPATAAIITINYCSIACDYEKLIPICKEKNIFLIEDNAHGIGAKYQQKYLGGFGDISTISFDFLKNISCDEGGGITINNSKFFKNFSSAYHFGTNKSDFLAGNVNAYEWKTKGTNSILAQPLAKILYEQLIHYQKINQGFLEKWNFYYNELQGLHQASYIDLPKIPKACEINGHTFWIKVKDINERNRLTQFLSDHQIEATFHYTALHQSEYGKQIGEFRGEDKFTTKDSQRILRLPQYYHLQESEQIQVIEKISEFYKKV